jgi:hypothetical protein
MFQSPGLLTFLCRRTVPMLSTHRRLQGLYVWHTSRHLAPCRRILRAGWPQRTCNDVHRYHSPVRTHSLMRAASRLQRTPRCTCSWASFSETMHSWWCALLDAQSAPACSLQIHADQVPRWRVISEVDGGRQPHVDACCCAHLTQTLLRHRFTCAQCCKTAMLTS